MSFTVQIEPSGHRFEVEAGETILDGALRQGYAFPYGCRNGGCGACKGKLLSGEVDYGTNRPPALSDDDVAQGLGLFCQAQPLSDVVVEVKEIGAAHELAIKVLPSKVQKKEMLASDVVRLYLKLPESERMPFLAGQYIDILLQDGRRRSFSIANPPHDDTLIELHIRHVEGGDFTGYVMDELQEKDVLRIEGPHGHFHLREGTTRPLIFMAGGTGFAPIKGIIEHALAEGLSQPMYLYWGVRDEPDLYLADLPRQWAAQLAHFHFVPVLSNPAPDRGWTGRTGYVHEAVLEDFPDGLAEYEVYASGPPLMVNTGHATFIENGLPADRYFSDAFEFQRPSSSKA
jgi:CDP-4-dehydro-6-deoxyglucose reductase